MKVLIKNINFILIVICGNLFLIERVLVIVNFMVEGGVVIYICFSGIVIEGLILIVC